MRIVPETLLHFDKKTSHQLEFNIQFFSEIQAGHQLTNYVINLCFLWIEWVSVKSFILK